MFAKFVAVSLLTVVFSGSAIGRDEAGGTPG